MAIALGSLAGCHPPSRAVTRSPAESSSYAARHPVLHGPSRFLASRWTFSIGDGACVARTRHPELSFSVTVGPEHSIVLTVDSTAPIRPAMRRAEPAELSFAGGSGSWRASAHSQGRVVHASLPATDEGLQDVLALLAGGQLSVRTIDGSLPGLNVPDAGVAGRDWFGCPRDRLEGAGQS